MSGRIKGITVVIGGDTTGLEKSLKSVNDTICKTQSSLRDVNKLLKLDPTNTTLLTQKQGYLKTAIDATKQKLEALKDAQAQAKSQMESGDLGAEKYKALQREVISTEEDLKKLEDQAEKEKNALDKIGDVGAKFSELGDNVADAGKKLLPLSATIAAVGTASMAAWHQLDDAYDNISISWMMLTTTSLPKQELPVKKQKNSMTLSTRSLVLCRLKVRTLLMRLTDLNNVLH